MRNLRPPEELAAILRELRGDLSLAAFAEKVGKPGQGPQFGKYEKAGTRTGVVPSMETLAKVAQSLGVPEAIFYEQDAAAEECPPLSYTDMVKIRDQLREIRALTTDAIATVQRALSIGDPPPTQQIPPEAFTPVPDPRERHGDPY